MLCLQPHDHDSLKKLLEKQCLAAVDRRKPVVIRDALKAGRRTKAQALLGSLKIPHVCQQCQKVDVPCRDGMSDLLFRVLGTFSPAPGTPPLPMNKTIFPLWSGSIKKSQSIALTFIERRQSKAAHLLLATTSFRK